MHNESSKLIKRYAPRVKSGMPQDNLIWELRGTGASYSVCTIVVSKLCELRLDLAQELLLDHLAWRDERASLIACHNSAIDILEELFEEEEWNSDENET